MRNLNNELDKLIRRMDDMQAYTPAAVRSRAGVSRRTLEDVQADIAAIQANISKLEREFTECKRREQALDEQVADMENSISEMKRTGNYEVPDLRLARSEQEKTRRQSMDLMRTCENITDRIKAEEKRFNALNFELSGYPAARSTPQPA